MRTSQSPTPARYASAGLAVLLIATLIGCQQPLGPTSTSPDYTINGPGTPPAVDAALQNQPPVAAPIAGQTNLLRNPDLENFTGNNPDNWVPCAPNALLPSSDAASGLRAVLIAQNRSCLYQSAQVTPGQSLNLTCQAKLVQDQGWTGWGLTFYDASFQKLGDAPTRRITSLNYEQYDTSATAPANAAYATAWAYSEGQMLLDQCNLSVADTSSVGDLMVNGGFEGNLTNWTNCNDANLISISTQAQSGARALRLAQNGCAYQNTELKPNHEYEFTCQAKVSGNRYTEISLVYMDANWKTIIRKGSRVSAGTYSSSSVRLLTPTNMVRSAVALYNQSDEALFDTCTLKDTGLEIVSEEFQKGKWSGVQAWPLLAIHASLLPTGEVLAWDSNNDDIETNSLPDHPFRPTRATLWNPNTNAFTGVNSNTGKDLFCAGHTVLANGNVIAAGGNQVPGNGQHNAISIFNPSNNTWTRGPDMAANRWYPSVTNLANGDALITSGGPSIPEVYSSSGTLRRLTGADLGLALYPWMQLAPNGKVVHFGPEGTLHSLDTSNTGGWTTLGTRDSNYRDYGSYAMYAPGKVLVTGGAASLSTTQIVDVNNGLNTSSAAAMNFGRRQHNLTLLPDGSAIATGGISNGAGLVDVNAAVYPAEVWKPSLDRWDLMASAVVPRQYHSTALLLPDGRILSAGGGFCGACPLATYFNKNAEIFSPTYLFNKDGTPAVRPSISSAPASAAYASSFAVTTNTTTNTDIARVTLIAPSSVTHSVNMNQRFLELAFTKSGNSLSVTAPANANFAPPGTYMLFVLNAQGVPSVAKMVKIQ